MLPWGTPAFSRNSLDKNSLTLILPNLFVRKFDIHLIIATVTIIRWISYYPSYYCYNFLHLFIYIFFQFQDFCLDLRIYTGQFLVSEL